MMDRPRHARKDVRALADWLAQQGWEFDGLDSHKHTVWRWPASGYRLTLPETPRGSRWLKITKAEACKVMGIQLRGKYHGTSTAEVIATARKLAEQHEAQRQRILAERERLRQQADEDRARDQARREARQLAVLRTLDADRHRREIESLMRPGYGR